MASFGPFTAPRLNPTRVPTVPVVVNQQHPLGQNVAAFILFNAGKPIDVLDRYVPIISGTPTVSSALSSRGAGLKLTPVGGKDGYVVSTSRILGGNANWTLSALFLTTAAATSNGLVIYSETPTSGGNDIASLAINTTTAPGVLNPLYRDDAGTLLDVANTVNVCDGKPHLSQFVFLGSSATFWTDGKADAISGNYASGTVTGNSITYGGTTNFTNALNAAIGYYTSVASSSYSGLLIALVLRRTALTKDLIAWEAAEPFAALNPVVQRTISIPNTSVPFIPPDFLNLAPIANRMVPY
jgi:hypothetical protein